MNVYECAHATKVGVKTRRGSADNKLFDNNFYIINGFWRGNDRPNVDFVIRNVFSFCVVFIRFSMG